MSRKTPAKMSIAELEQLPINDTPSHTIDGFPITPWDITPAKAQAVITDDWLTFVDTRGKRWDVGKAGGRWCRRAVGAA